MKIFAVKSGNSIKKAAFDVLEANLNEWLDDHPNMTIEHTQALAQPNLGWGLTALAVWYTEQ
jgi:hypothetical protein